MVLPLFEANDADSVWRQAFFALEEDGKAAGSRLGATSELMHATLVIRDPRQRWVFSRLPAINPAFAIAECVWIIGGRRDAAFPNHWNPALPRFSGKGETYHGAYGWRIRNHFGFDQLLAAARSLARDAEAGLRIYDPAIDLPDANGAPRSPDIPCNVASNMLLRDGRLWWTQVMRSNDIYRGTPHNLVQFSVLQEIMAGWIGAELGPYHHVADSLHLYAADSAEARVETDAPFAENTDELALPRAVFDTAFPVVKATMDAMVARSLGSGEFMQALAVDLPTGWRNALLIAAADSARRSGWLDEMATCAARCTNPALRLAWERWFSRQEEIRNDIASV